MPNTSMNPEETLSHLRSLSAEGNPQEECQVGRATWAGFNSPQIHVYHKLSVHSYADGCVGIIRILALGNDAEMNYYSALTWEEVLSYRKTWMNLENTMVSETSQSPKDKHSMAPLGWSIYNSQTHRSWKWTGWVPRAQGGGIEKLIFNGFRLCHTRFKF